MSNAWRRTIVLAASLTALSLTEHRAVAQEAEAPPTIGTLQGVDPPAPPRDEYNALVKNKKVLQALGKALFWDGAIGSDGVACASCHFHAGADPRLRNQLNPGILNQPAGDEAFGNAAGLLASGGRAGPNVTLKRADFPFHQLEDVDDRESTVLYDTNDAASSQGVFDGTFVSTIKKKIQTKKKLRNFCDPNDDTIFQINVNGTPKKVRKVEPRNTPTAINAAYFFRNFWDGRANNVFNGVNPFGLRDSTARIVTANASGGLQLEELALENMSLASQAVGPVGSTFEMACEGRSFADVGRRILTARVLQTQKVEKDDSLLGTDGPVGKFAQPTANGLKAKYLELVKLAFQDRLWAGTGTYKVTSGGALVADAAGYSQAELNFSLFFGLAVDAYERLLVSDQTPFDRFAKGDENALNAQEKLGLDVFKDKGKCVNCHTGPLFSSAAVPPRQRKELIENMVMGDRNPALYDGGFYNIGVRPTFEDIGVGGADPWGIPLSFTRQFVSGNKVDRFPNPAGGRLGRVAVDGAFKTPSLRNVALTAPYFHNGGEATLRDVVQFYDRGGNRRSIDGGDTSGTGSDGRLNQAAAVTPGMGGSNLDADIQSLKLTDDEIEALVAFMKALTDPRVACHKGPFDHPELIVSNGAQLKANGKRALDMNLRLAPVGRGGYPAAWCDPNTGDLFGRNLIGGMLTEKRG